MRALILVRNYNFKAPSIFSTAEIVVDSNDRTLPLKPTLNNFHLVVRLTQLPEHASFDPF